MLTIFRVKFNRLYTNRIGWLTCFYIIANDNLATSISSRNHRRISGKSEACPGLLHISRRSNANARDNHAKQYKR